MKKLSKISFLAFLAMALFYGCQKDQGTSNSSVKTKLEPHNQAVGDCADPYDPYNCYYEYTTCSAFSICPGGSDPGATYSMTSTGTGLTINSTTGCVTGTPSTTQTVTVTITDASGTGSESFTVLLPITYPAVFTSGTGYYNTNVYNQGATITAVYPTLNGFTPTSYSISPSLSSNTGLSFSTTTGEIYGTASIASAPTTYTVTATSGSCIATTSFTLAVGFAFTFHNTSSQLISETFQYSNGVEYGYYNTGVSAGSTVTLWLPPGTYSNIAINAASGYPPPTIGITFYPSGTSWRGTYGHTFTSMTINSTANSNLYVTN